jgi:hypothetical protein
VSPGTGADPVEWYSGSPPALFGQSDAGRPRSLRGLRGAGVPARIAQAFPLPQYPPNVERESPRRLWRFEAPLFVDEVSHRRRRGAPSAPPDWSAASPSS